MLHNEEEIAAAIEAFGYSVEEATAFQQNNGFVFYGGLSLVDLAYELVNAEETRGLSADELGCDTIAEELASKGYYETTYGVIKQEKGKQTMLKTNSKKARENIRTYIMDRFDPTGYDLEYTPETFEAVARVILETFQKEKHYHLEYIKAKGISMQAIFTEWCSGLPSILDTCYYYNRSALNELALILEETDAEKGRYSESLAEEMLTYLIYRELQRGAM